MEEAAASDVPDARRSAARLNEGRDKTMAGQFLQHIRSAIANLNPGEVRQTAERPVAIGLVASNSAAFAAMEDYFSPAAFSRAKRWETTGALHRVGDPGAPTEFDIEIWEEGLPGPPEAVSFSPRNPQRTVREVLDRCEELGLPLARQLYPFRQPVVDRVVQTIARENALFALMTALSDLMPSLLEIPWFVGEFASDTGFLTVNQVRMAFLIAAASDRPVGYREQRSQIASIITAAFGWRALARELAGKIPFGAGLIPKAAIAYAGTYVVGLSLDRICRVGYGYTRAERRLAYESAFERGRELAGKLLDGVRKPAS
jgi:hypothetical protein